MTDGTGSTGLLQGAVATLLVAPLLGAALAALAGRHARGVAVAALVCSAGGAALGLTAVAPATVALGGWPAPLGMELRADALGLGLALLASALMAVLALVRYPGADGSAYWSAWCLAASALTVVFVTEDLFNAYVALELLGVAAVTLVALGSGSGALTAALRYLVVGLVGAALYLFGVAVLYLQTGTLDIALVAARAPDAPATVTALALMSAGLLIKAAAFPFHAWLPPAHGAAPAPASAVLSGLVLKAALFLLWRLWSELAPASAAAFGAELLGALGVASILWGSLGALQAQQLKAILAYGSIVQVGYLLLVAAFLAAGRHELLTEGLLLLASHALAKSAAFLAAGGLALTLGAHTLADLRGAVERAPVCVLALGLASVALVGLPPSAAFAGKWGLLQAGLETERWLWTGALATGTLLSAAYLLRPIGAAFELGATSAAALRPERCAVPALALALAAFLSLPLGHWAAAVGAA